MNSWQIAFDVSVQECNSTVDAPTTATPLRPLLRRGDVNQSARSGGIVKIDAIELEALHRKIMNQHIVGFVNGNADR